MDKLFVWGGKCPYKSRKQSTGIIVIAIVLFLYFSDPLLMEDIS